MSPPIACWPASSRASICNILSISFIEGALFISQAGNFLNMSFRGIKLLLRMPFSSFPFLWWDWNVLTVPLGPTCLRPATLGSGGEGVFSGDPPARSEATEGGVEHPLPRSEQDGILVFRWISGE